MLPFLPNSSITSTAVSTVLFVDSKRILFSKASFLAFKISNAELSEVVTVLLDDRRFLSFLSKTSNSPVTLLSSSMSSTNLF